VMVGIGVEVHEGLATPIRDRAQHRTVSTFRDVSDALEHARQGRTNRRSRG
jgi:hypothetical protein